MGARSWSISCADRCGADGHDRPLARRGVWPGRRARRGGCRRQRAVASSPGPAGVRPRPAPGVTGAGRLLDGQDARMSLRPPGVAAVPTVPELQPGARGALAPGRRPIVRGFAGRGSGAAGWAPGRHLGAGLVPGPPSASAAPATGRRRSIAVPEPAPLWPADGGRGAGARPLDAGGDRRVGLRRRASTSGTLAGS